MHTPYVSLSLPMSFVFPKNLISRGPKRDSSISVNQQVHFYLKKGATSVLRGSKSVLQLPENIKTA
jgi:hypothetical protein